MSSWVMVVFHVQILVVTSNHFWVLEFCLRMLSGGNDVFFCLLPRMFQQIQMYSSVCVSTSVLSGQIRWRVYLALYHGLYHNGQGICLEDIQHTSWTLLFFRQNYCLFLYEVAYTSYHYSSTMALRTHKSQYVAHHIYWSQTHNGKNWTIYM
jgi:hypothetical protein